MVYLPARWRDAWFVLIPMIEGGGMHGLSSYDRRWWDAWFVFRPWHIMPA